VRGWVGDGWHDWSGPGEPITTRWRDQTPRVEDENVIAQTTEACDVPPPTQVNDASGNGAADHDHVNRTCPTAIVLLGRRQRGEDDTVTPTQVIVRPLKVARATQIPPNILSIPRAQVVTRDARREMVDAMISQGRALPPRDVLDRLHTCSDRELRMMIATTEPQISRRANSEEGRKRTRTTTTRSTDESEMEEKPAKRMSNTLARWDDIALARYQRQMEMDVT
jgi:hypothetical protein